LLQVWERNAKQLLKAAGEGLVAADSQQENSEAELQEATTALRKLEAVTESDGSGQNS